MDNVFDKMFYSEGDLLAGVDESGVSDIAGPLVAACVVLPRIDVRRDDLRIFEVDDSKKIDEKWRKKHAEVIWQTALAIGIGEVSPTEYDFLSRQDAMALAHFRAAVVCKSIRTNKPVRPDFILVDGEFPVPIDIRQAVLPDADEKSLCCAAASIIAKVYRDEIMVKLHERYPFYDWARNKGFPNGNHFQGIDRHGIQPGIHRTKKWPFVSQNDFTEDRVYWRKRRQNWRKITLEKLSREVGETCWTPRPPLWKPSPSFSHQPPRAAKSGKATRSSNA